jgi:hypothetical protein
MPTPAAERSRDGAAAPLELIRTEAKSKAAAVGLGIGAALVLFYGLGFLFATIAVALALVLATWLALLLVTLGLFATAGILVSLARSRFKGDGAPVKEKLETAVEQLRTRLGDATDVSGKLRGRLPAVAAGALGAGFFLAGGIGATMRFLARKGRER